MITSVRHIAIGESYNLNVGLLFHVVIHQSPKNADSLRV